MQADRLGANGGRGVREGLQGAFRSLPSAPEYAGTTVSCAVLDVTFDLSKQHSVSMQVIAARRWCTLTVRGVCLWGFKRSRQLRLESWPCTAIRAQRLTRLCVCVQLTARVAGDDLTQRLHTTILDVLKQMCEGESAGNIIIDTEQLATMKSRCLERLVDSSMYGDLSSFAEPPKGNAEKLSLLGDVCSLVMEALGQNLQQNGIHALAKGNLSQHPPFQGKKYGITFHAGGHASLSSQPTAEVLAVQDGKVGDPAAHSKMVDLQVSANRMIDSSVHDVFELCTQLKQGALQAICSSGQAVNRGMAQPLMLIARVLCRVGADVMQWKTLFLRPFTDKATDALGAALQCMTPCIKDKSGAQCVEGISVLANYLFRVWLESRGLILKRAEDRRTVPLVWLDLAVALQSSLNYDQIAHVVRHLSRQGVIPMDCTWNYSCVKGNLERRFMSFQSARRKWAAGQRWQIQTLVYARWCRGNLYWIMCTECSKNRVVGDNVFKQYSIDDSFVCRYLSCSLSCCCLSKNLIALTSMRMPAVCQV